ncbi:MAG: glycosyltransferase family 2 protein [Myxococcota bacterium]
MPHPTISVVIPTYNRATYLPLSVQSVLAQDVPVLEILIVDDGSTDNTAAVVAELEGPIRYLPQKNAGPATARNHGIREAKGEWVAFLDSDDLWELGKLRRQLELASTDTRIGMVHGAARIIDKEGKLTGELWTKPDYRGACFEKLSIANGVNASSVLVKRSLLEHVGGYDTQFAALENWELWLRLSLHCHFAYSEQPLSRYRIHGGNLIKDLSRTRRAYELLLKKHMEGAQSPPTFLRRRAYARFYEAFADGHVGRGEYHIAQQLFLKSLFLEPWQPDIWWRLFRVSTSKDPVRSGK